MSSPAVTSPPVTEPPTTTPPTTTPPTSDPPTTTPESTSNPPITDPSTTTSNPGPTTSPGTTTNPGTTSAQTSSPGVSNPGTTTGGVTTSDPGNGGGGVVTNPGSSAGVTSPGGSSSPAVSTAGGPSSALVGTTFVSTAPDGRVETITGSATVAASDVRASTTRFVTVTLTDGSTVVSGITEGSTGSGGSGSNTGAIVGGAVGGAVGLALIGALIWFLLRRKKRNEAEEFDDMMFDPARGHRRAAPGATDLVDPEPNVVDPYNYPPAGHTSAATGGIPEMSQYSAAGGPLGSTGTQQAAYGAGYAAAGAGAGAALGGMIGSRSDGSDVGYGEGVQRGPSSGSTLTSPGYAGRGAGQNPYGGTGGGGGGYGDTMMPLPMPTGGSASSPDHSSYPATGATTPSAGTAASRKMREAQQERLRNMYSQNDHGDDGARSPGTAPTSPGTETVAESEARMPRVHEDGGRFPQGDEELPPQYHSIPADRQ